LVGHQVEAKARRRVARRRGDDPVPHRNDALPRTMGAQDVTFRDESASGHVRGTSGSA
jgi:uncharacterized protein (DUF924 family)